MGSAEATSAQLPVQVSWCQLLPPSGALTYSGKSECRRRLLLLKILPPAFASLFLRARQFRDHVEVLERRRIALDLSTCGDLFEQPTHDLPGASLGQCFSKPDIVRLRHRTNFFP